MREGIRSPVTHMATGVKTASTPGREGSPSVFRSGLAPRSLAEEPDVTLVVSITSTLGRGSSLAGLTGSARDSSMDDVSDNPLYMASGSARGDLTGVVEEMLALRAPKKSPSFRESGWGGGDDTILGVEAGGITGMGVTPEAFLADGSVRQSLKPQPPAGWAFFLGSVWI